MREHRDRLGEHVQNAVVFAYITRLFFWFPYEIWENSTFFLYLSYSSIHGGICCCCHCC